MGTRHNVTRPQQDSQPSRNHEFKGKSPARIALHPGSGLCNQHRLSNGDCEFLQVLITHNAFTPTGMQPGGEGSRSPVAEATLLTAFSPLFAQLAPQIAEENDCAGLTLRRSFEDRPVAFG